MRDDHVATLAKELRSSLAVILGFARTLEQRNLDLGPDERAELVQHVVDQADRLGTLTGNVLAASRGGEAPGVSTSVDHVVREAAADATSFPEPRRVRVSVTPDLHTGMAADDLHVLVTNLVTNALRFAYPGSRVDVTAHQQGEQVLLQVRNVGPSIPRGQLERIFEPFVSGVTPDDPAPGFGYGLYVVRTLVDAHGGRVVAIPTPDGMAFSVSLSVAEPELRLTYDLTRIDVHAGH